MVIAGGAWSGRFGDQLGIELPITPERGQIVHLRTDAFDDQTNEWPIVNAFGELYAVSWPDGRIAIGATREQDSGFDAYPTVEGVETILSGATRLLPGASDAEFLEVRVGLRPVSSDGRPIIGNVPGVTGAFIATGHGSTGLHLGPCTGLVVSELVRGRK
ncbi:FAD-dependent oxidoreductase (plasmid) [Haloterrigena alkaliphila]|nr:FAD-dependent oxidoreductase [Haloterrigena alkaliphila]